jgi:diguanylate cyclase (GGDEF)-like protein/PAS domain S-box-containing protein
MNNLSIRLRVLMLAIAPLTIVVALVATHFALSRLQDLDNALRDRGQAIAGQLAPACEYGVFSGNREILARLAHAALREKDVLQVIVSDHNGTILANAINGVLRSTSNDVGVLTFSAAIERSTLLVDDYAEDNGESSGAPVQDRIGEISVTLSEASTAARQRQVLLESLVIALGGLVVTTMLAWWIGRAITEPVIRMTKAVERIRRGDLGQRVTVASGGELGDLELGINEMADGLNQARESEKKRVAAVLFQERVRAQVTLESIGDGVITTDSGGYILYMNPVAVDLTGWEMEDAEGHLLSEVFRVIDERVGHERDYPLFVPLREGRLLRHENRHALLRKDGQRFSIQDSSAPIRDGEGRILGAVVVFHDITEMQHLVNKMAFLATHDSLTGLLNRHEFEIRLQQALESARAAGAQHAVCYMDLDQFKIVNDTCGHIAGDELLKQLTHQLHAKVRPTDVLARLGGDEFGVILDDCNLDAAYAIAEGLRQVVKDFRFVWQDKSFDVGVSIGLVPISPHSGSMTDVLSAADSACYVAKDHGRNRVHIYQPDDDALARRHGEMQWVQRISDGLSQDRFQLYAQRIVPIAASGPEYCEILLRLEESGKALIPPSAFIPAAERYYLMPAIDRWVIARAFSMLRDALAQQGSIRTAMYTINLSGQSLCDDAFLDFVTEHLQVSGIPAELICFEITETAAIANLSRAIGFISRLKAKGCKFALDDFGSGLSSFGYLKNLPVDYLKIAGNFIQDIVVDPVDHAMVDAINQIGHVMGLRTIAESVESKEILARLHGLGVDYAQGYGVHEPDSLARLLRS